MKERSLAIGGAVVAIVASLCCVGPVLFALLGLGAFGAAALFASARPYLLAGSVLLVAFGFYRTYFRRQTACAPGEACATKPINRGGRVGLWIASVGVLAFALAPYYVGHIASALHRQSATTTALANPALPAPNEDARSQAALETITVKVEGMSCAACEVPIRDALAKTPGVRSADVSYERGDAQIKYAPKQTNVTQIKRACDLNWCWRITKLASSIMKRRPPVMRFSTSMHRTVL
jgi:mercuric ion transport protein